jgi:hypothetical protein
LSNVLPACPAHWNFPPRTCVTRSLPETPRMLWSVALNTGKGKGKGTRSVFSIHFSLQSFPPLFLVILFFSTYL